MTRLLQDCADYHQNPSGLILCENGENSCNYVNSTISYIFNSTFIEWGNQSFYFIAFVDKRNPVLEKGKQCERSEERESKYSYVKVNSGILTIRLDMCG